MASGRAEACHTARTRHTVSYGRTYELYVPKVIFHGPPHGMPAMFTFDNTDVRF